MVKKVIIYSTEFCTWCRRTKEFFKENNAKFSEKDVGNDLKAAKEMVKKSGQQSVPVIDVDGEIFIGYDESALKKALGIK